MELLQAGVDFSVIALWLGRESIETTQTIRISHSRKHPGEAQTVPAQEANPLPAKAIACSPSLRRYNKPDYAE